MYPGSCNRALLGMFVAVLAVSGCDEDRCPSIFAPPAYPGRPLTVAEMRIILEYCSDDDPKKLVSGPGWCSPVRVGVDARNGLPVFVVVHCDDVCPDYARFLVTYDPDMTHAECQRIGQCYLQGGATLAYIYCLPFPQGYHFCPPD